MPGTYSIIEGGRVVSHALAEADYAQAQGWVPAGDSKIGDYWNAETGYSPGPGPEVPGADYRITRLAFRNRFLPAEKVTLELASLDNPAGPLLARQQAAALRAYLADVAAATFVDLSRADTRAGVQYLETVTLIAAGRAAAILDAPIQAEERPVFLGV